jgi:hypothetical protein
MTGGASDGGAGAGVFDATSRSCGIYDGIVGASGVCTASGALTIATGAFTISGFFKVLNNPPANVAGPRLLFGVSKVASPAGPVATPTDWLVAVYFTGTQTDGAGQEPWKASIRRSGEAAFDTVDFTSGSGKEREYLPIGKWCHIALTYDGTNFFVYKDGKFAGYVAAAGALDTSGTERVVVGSIGTAAGQACQFADLRYDNAVLTAAQIMTRVMASKLSL